MGYFVKVLAVEHSNGDTMMAEQGDGMKRRSVKETMLPKTLPI